MENHEYDQVIGSNQAPFINQLARQYVSLQQHFGVRHPSLPNYLALTGGDTFGITNDCTACHVNATNLVDQLEQANVSWKAYMEGLPSVGFTGDGNCSGSGCYKKKHDPFVYYDDVVGTPERLQHIVPATQLSADLTNNSLPQFSWLTPDMCHDTHDCTVGVGDAYLAQIVPRILPDLGPNGILIVTYDEGDTGVHGGGRIPTVIAGPGANNGMTIDVQSNHYSTLRLIEDIYGLGYLRNAAGANSISGALK